MDRCSARKALRALVFHSLGRALAARHTWAAAALHHLVLYQALT